MEKVEKFKSLCQELQKRKLDLDKEVNNYVNLLQILIRLAYM